VNFRRFAISVGLALVVPACSWDLGKLFDREDPSVEQARALLRASYPSASASAASRGDAGGDATFDLEPARALLEEVVRFHCGDIGDAGNRQLVAERPGASLDLGLVMFRISELFGARFGDEELDPGNEQAQQRTTLLRGRELDCARLLLERVALDPSTSSAMRLRARYLLGNFSLITRKYSDAIEAYDAVLVEHPAHGDDVGEVGAPTDDDAVARDAAWNRAIALRRLDAHDDAGSDGGDSGDDAGNDGGGDGASGDSGSDGASGDSASGNDGGDAAPSPSASTSPSASAAPAASASSSVAPMPSSSGAFDLRELDRFDQKAPIDPDQPQHSKEKHRPPKAFDK
jgi:hypothetical protein